MRPNARRKVQILLFYLKRISKNPSLQLRENRDMLENRYCVSINIFKFVLLNLKIV